MKAVVSKNLYDFHLDLQDDAPQCYLLAYQSRSLTLTQIRRGHTRITLANKMEGLVLTGFHLEVLSFVYWALELHGHPRKKETGEDQASRERVSEFGWCTKELLGMDTGWLEVDLSKQTTEVEPLQCPELVTWFLAVGVKAKRNFWENSFQWLVLDPDGICFTWTHFWNYFVSLHWEKALQWTWEKINLPLSLVEFCPPKVPFFLELEKNNVSLHLFFFPGDRIMFH